jgi:hypothetical protein
MNDYEDELGIRPYRAPRPRPKRRRGGLRYPATYTAIDIEDLITMTKTLPNNEVLFGVSGISEWVSASHIRRHIDENTNTCIEDGTWLTPESWELVDWVQSISKRYNYLNKTYVIVFMPWGLLEVNSSKGKVHVQINGTTTEVLAFVKKMDKELKRAENLIEWVFGERGQSISVPLNYRPAIEGSYPWMTEDLFTYIDNYLDSSASVLILIGPPGTGKTSFIKNMIHRSEGDAKITYDEKVMNNDGLFAEFVESDTRFMIMEDADTFMKSRADGNTSMMHRFLNVSDGLISAADKKLVFSTNLPSIKDIDAALMRPGRCYDVLHFRALTRAEALVVAKNLKIDLPDGQEFTLAELFNQKPFSAPTSAKTVGFF